MKAARERRDAAIIAAVREGKTQAAISIEADTSQAYISMIVRQHENKTGERLSRATRWTANASRNVAIIAAVRAGRTQTAIAREFGIWQGTVSNIIKQHESKTGERFPRHTGLRKCLPRDRATARELEVVAAYRRLGTLEAVGAEIGVGRERVRQIVRRYEKATGELVPRTGTAQRWQRQREARESVG